jgi:hypothetical protein
MTGKVQEKRRLKLLVSLAQKAKWRHDIKISLAEIAPSLEIKGFAGGSKFVDSSKPVYEGGSDLAYDFNTLHEEGHIKQTYLESRQDNMGGTIYSTPGVMVTINGFAAVAEASKCWLKRAIEQQPMTFVQIVVTVFIAAVTGGGGWLIGRYTASTEHHTQRIVEQSAPSAHSDPAPSPSPETPRPRAQTAAP